MASPRAHRGPNARRGPGLRSCRNAPVMRAASPKHYSRKRPGVSRPVVSESPDARPSSPLFCPPFRSGPTRSPSPGRAWPALESESELVLISVRRQKRSCVSHAFAEYHLCRPGRKVPADPNASSGTCATLRGRFERPRLGVTTTPMVWGAACSPIGTATASLCQETDSWQRRAQVSVTNSRAQLPSATRTTIVSLPVCLDRRPTLHKKEDRCQDGCN